MRSNSARYTYKIFWFEPDQKFVGTCVDMPGLSYLDVDAEAAGRGIRELVAFAVDEMIGEGEVPPHHKLSLPAPPMSPKQVTAREVDLGMGQDGS
jgi:hypothetical protein